MQIGEFNTWIKCQFHKHLLILNVGWDQHSELWLCLGSKLLKKPWPSSTRESVRTHTEPDNSCYCDM